MADIEDLRQLALHGFLDSVDGLDLDETDEEKAFHVGQALAFRLLAKVACDPKADMLFELARKEPVDIHSERFAAADLAHNRAYRRMMVHSDPSYAGEYDEDNRPYDV